MRVASILAWAAMIAGCGGSTAPPPAHGLDLALALPAPSMLGDVAIASVMMRFGSVVAVSDRAADDPRATVSDIELALGDTTQRTLPSSPPGLYSAVGARLGSPADIGLDVQGVWNAVRVHATLTSAPFDVACATPVRLDASDHAQLTLRADPTGWFANVDLASGVTDADDNGIVISEDDNEPLADALLANVVASFTLACDAR